jgi:hypothetical protein
MMIQEQRLSWLASKRGWHPQPILEQETLTSGGMKQNMRKGEGVTMQRRNCFSRVKAAAPGLFLIFLFIYYNSNLLPAPPGNNSGEAGKSGRHFILLLDSKVAVGNISRTDNASTGDDFFNLLENSLGKKTYHMSGEKHNDTDLGALGYKSYEQGRDIVSIVLHHFPAKGGSSTNVDKNSAYFYTFPEIIFIEKFLDSKKELSEFLKNKFKHDKTFQYAMSPEKLANAEEIVLPYLCDKHNSDGYKKNSNYAERFRKLEEYTINDIIIISIYEKARENKPLEPDEKWQQFNDNFEYKRIKRDQSNKEKNIVIDYFSVKPRHKKDISILAANKDGKYPLERYAQRSSGLPLHYWQGESGLAGLAQGYRWQWAGETASGGIQWQEADETAGQGTTLYLAKKASQVYIKSAYIKENNSVKVPESNGERTIKIYYRMVINDFKPGGNLQYPFKYSPAIEVKPITYQLREVEKYAPGFPWLKSAGKIDEKDLEERLLTLKLKELSAGTAATNSRAVALRELLGVYAGIIALLFVLYLFFYRDPKIKFDIKPVEEVPVDFSRENREIKDLADLEWQNTRKWLAAFKKRKTFDVNLEVEWDDKPGGRNVNLDPHRLLSVERMFDRRARKESALPLKWDEEGCFQLVLPGVCVGDKFKILIDTDAVQDLTPGDKEEKEMETVLLAPTFNMISAVFTKNEKPVSLEKRTTSLKPSLNFIFKPETGTPELHVQHVENEENINFTYDREHEKYTIPYSNLRLQQALFKVTVKNKCTHQYSRPGRMELSYKVFQENALRDGPGSIFYLLSSPQWDPEKILPQTRDITLLYGEERDFYFFINFKDILENPTIPVNFRIQVLEDGNPVRDGDKNITVTGAVERTEALICFTGENEPVYPAERHRYTGILNADKELVINEDSEDEISLAYRFPEQGRLSILSGKPTLLFALELRNSCITHTGWYKWDICALQMIPNEYISLEKTGPQQAIYYKIYRGTKKVEDKKDANAQVEFYLDHKTARLKKYEISFELTFVLDLVFCPAGEENGKISRKRIFIKAVIEGRHNVAPDYLVIDFGTSAIAVERRNRTGDGGEQEKTHRMEFQSPKDHLESKNGLMPSVINLNENEIIGSHRFVSLPAKKSMWSIEPGKLVSSLKMRILNGDDKIELPANFSYINEYGIKCTGTDKNRNACTCNQEERQNCKRIKEDGVTCAGDHIDLKGLLLSAYRNLKQNYLNPCEEIRGYKRLIITHPNLYNNSHIEFLKQVLYHAFVDPGENIYDRNIILVSESDASLYYYLQKIAEEKEPEKPGNIMVIDIGGGTLDISLAKVEWDNKGNIPTAVEITRKDGVGYAGEELDKAIALQVHQLLLRYGNQVGSYREVESISPAVTPEDDIKEQIFRSLEEGREDTRPKFEVDVKETPAPAVEDYYFKYINRIAAPREETGKNEYSRDLIQAMMDFKYEYILAFKENMGTDASPHEAVGICLGGNGTTRGLCDIKAATLPLDFKIGGKTVKTSIESGSDGNLYLKLKRADWLSLPYLARFKELFITKIDSFFDNNKKNIPGNLLVALSGRTSLWPDIQSAVQDYLGIKPKLVSKHKSNTKEKGLKMKQAVADGALQKIATWGYLPFRDIPQIGKPALRYQTGPNFYNPECWTVTTLDKDNPVKIDLGSSDVFYLGIKTSLDFVPFMGANYFERKLYCKEKMEVTIYVEEYKENETDDKAEWEFFIGSDKYKKKRLLIEHGAVKYPFLSLRGTNWPIKNPQLPEVEPGEFDERV